MSLARNWNYKRLMKCRLISQVGASNRFVCKCAFCLNTTIVKTCCSPTSTLLALNENFNRFD